MRIDHLRLQGRDLEQQRSLFVERFGLPALERTPDRLSLQVGHTTLTFEQSDEWTGMYHFAIKVPEHQFHDAVDWLAQYGPFLSNSAGQTRFDFDNWNAHAVYFADADGNIVEFIAHHDHKTPSTTPFSASSLLGISEIGLVVDAVPATVDSLASRYGVTPYRGSTHEEFTAIGDMEGLFIVVKRNRPWLPTGQPATAGRFTLTFTTATGHHQFVADGE